MSSRIEQLAEEQYKEQFPVSQSLCPRLSLTVTVSYTHTERVRARARAHTHTYTHTYKRTHTPTHTYIKHTVKMSMLGDVYLTIIITNGIVSMSMACASRKT